MGALSTWLFFLRNAAAARLAAILLVKEFDLLFQEAAGAVLPLTEPFYFPLEVALDLLPQRRKIAD
jgi:hypothetical protein